MIVKKKSKSIVLFEKLRGGFNLTEFKNLSKFASGKLLAKYAREKLGSPIGRGTARVVFILSSGKVLKIAHEEKSVKKGAGEAQNQLEVKISSHPSAKNVVAKVFDYDPKYKWIISELTKPLTPREIKNIFKINYDLFDEILTTCLEKNISAENAMKYLLKSYKELYDLNKNNNDSLKKEYLETIEQLKNANIDIIKPVIDGILAMKRDFGFDTSDLDRFENYGRTPDGRLVVIDYGFDDTIGDKYYP